MNNLERLILRCYAAVVLTFLALPLLVVVGAAFSESKFLAFPPNGLTLRWFTAIVQDASFVGPFFLSVKLAFLSALAAILIGLPASFAIARGRGWPVPIFNAMLLSPMMLPNLVFGVSLLQCWPAFGLAPSFLMLLAGHTAIVTPYVVRTTVASLQGSDILAEEASMDLGDIPSGTFFRIILPTIKSGLVAGALFSLVMSWINVEVSMFVTGARNTTLPVYMFNYVQYNVDTHIACASAITVLFGIAAVFLIDWILGIDSFGRTNGT